jgi:hypothetical protein
MDQMEKVTEALNQARELLKDRRFWQLESQEKRNPKARAILNELLQSSGLP